MTTGTITNKPTSFGLTESFVTKEKEEADKIRQQSFIQSQKIVATEVKITGTKNVPSKKVLDEKTVQELMKLKFQEVEW